MPQNKLSELMKEYGDRPLSEIMDEMMKQPPIEKTGEDDTRLSDMMKHYHPTPSVEKSEGEEATAFEILQHNLTIKDTPEFREIHLPEILTAMEQYAHSSGDRGRKEWPSEEEIKQRAEELYQTTPMSNQIHREQIAIDRQIFIDGAQWAINEVRQMNQGQKSKS